MKKTIMAAALAMVLGTIALASTPSVAQEEREAQVYRPGEKPPPPPPDYAYFKGEVYIDGDFVISCREFAEDFERVYDEYGVQAQAQRVLKQCEQAGMPGMRIPAEVRAEIRQDARGGMLPETGGALLSLLAAGLLLAGTGLFAVRMLSGSRGK